MSQIQVPKGWLESDLFEIIEPPENGARPTGGVKSITEGIPSLGGEHLNYDGRFNFEKIKFVPEDFFHDLKKGIIKMNDILIVKDGATTGKTSFVDAKFPYKEACVNEHVFIIRTKEEILPKYLYYFLRSNFGQSLLKNKSQGIIGGINTKFVQDFPVVFPKDKDKQKKIIQKLDYVLGQLEEKKKQILALQNQESIEKLQKIISGSYIDTDFLKNNYNVTKLAELIIDARYGTSKKCVREDIGIPVIRIPNLKEGELDFSDLKYTNLKDSELQKLKLLAGDIVVCRTNGSIELIGKTGLFRNTSQPFAFASYLIRIRPDKNKVDPDYLNHILLSIASRNHIEKLAKTTAGQYNINLEILRSLEVPLPPLKEQEKITQNILKKKNQIKIINERLSKLKKLKDETINYFEKTFEGILNEAFSGKLVN